MFKKNRLTLIIIAAAIPWLIVAAVAMADSQTTHCVGYSLVRSAVASADADLNAAERTYAYYLANLTDKDYLPRHDNLSDITYANYLDIICTFNDAAATAVIKVFAIRNPDGVLKPLEPVCSYTLAAGAQQTDDATARYFADQATEVANPWAVRLIDYGGADGVLKIEFDTKGYYAFIILFTTISADDNVSSYCAYF
ncbi:MAG: hypothetical protein DRP56_11065 [Planctomycetota bacterium]|nr:MAG: hypothetical protein DRP56_11065 [Planctomycetota bacterium]